MIFESIKYEYVSLSFVKSTERKRGKHFVCQTIQHYTIFVHNLSYPGTS